MYKENNISGLSGFNFALLGQFRQFVFSGLNYFQIPDDAKQFVWDAILDGSFNSYASLIGVDSEGNRFIKFDKESTILKLLRSLLISKNWVSGLTGIIDTDQFIYSTTDEDAENILCSKYSNGVLVGGLLYSGITFYPEMSCPIASESVLPEEDIPETESPGTPATTTTVPCPCDCNEVGATEQWYLMRNCTGPNCYPVNVHSKRIDCKPVTQKTDYEIPCEQFVNFDFDNSQEGMSGSAVQNFYKFYADKFKNLFKSKRAYLQTFDEKTSKNYYAGVNR